MEIKRILVSRTDKIGDLVLSIPSFFMLRKMYPNAEIIVLVRNYNYDIVSNLKYIDRIIKIDDYTKANLLEKIEYFKADVFIALYNDEFVAALAKASKAKIRIGPLSKLNSIFTYNKGVLQKRSLSIKNEGEYNLDLVKKLNVNRFKVCYELNNNIPLTEQNKKVAEIYFDENKISGKCLVVNPFMGGSAKNITDEQYANILRRLKTEKFNDLNIIITCHISDEERAIKLSNLINLKNIFIFANGATILNTAAIIDKADVYFGPSTGPTHIAGALGKKIVAIYPNKKTQHPTRWGVLGNLQVKYIIPDENKKENYDNPYFESYDEEVENKIITNLEEALL